MASKSASPLEPEHQGVLGFFLRRDHRFPLLHLAFGVFALFSLFLALSHSPWRDEAQPWLFARDLDLRGLFYITRHNGHPLLWFLCLKNLQALRLNYLGMEVLNWLFCLGGVWLLFYRSTLPLAARLGVVFSPICLFEISSFARDYAIAMPLIFLAACFHPTAPQRPLRYSLVLALLASTNVFAAAVFVGISFQFLLEQALNGGTANFSWRPVFTKYLAANTILLLGAILLVLELAPIRFPGDPYPGVVSALHFEFSRLGRLAVFVLALTSTALVLFRRFPRVVAPLVGLALAGFPMTVYGFGGRHLFMLVLGIVYCCWVYLDDFLVSRSFAFFKLTEFRTRGLVTLIVLLSTLCFKNDVGHFRHHASDSREAAQAIIAHGLDRPDTVLVCGDSFRPMALYLFLQNIRDGYVPPEFGPSPQDYALDAYLSALFAHDYSADDLKPLVLETARQHAGKTVVVVVSGKGALVNPSNDDPRYHLTQIYCSPSPLTQETFRVWVLDPSPAASSPH